MIKSIKIFKIFFISLGLFVFGLNLFCYESTQGAIITDPCDTSKPYAWVSSTEIRFCSPSINVPAMPNATRFVLVAQALPLANWDTDTLKYNSSDYYLMSPQDLQDKSGAAYWIAIPKDNPSQGEIGDRVSSTHDPITLFDTQNAPPPIKKITSGSIAGSAYFEGKYSATNMDIIVSDSVTHPDRKDVELVYENDSGAPTTLATHHFEKDSSGDYFYTPFEIDKDDMPDKLWEGKYRLMYQHDETADCATGEARDDDVIDVAIGCTIQYYSVVNFKLKVDDAGVAYAYFEDGVNDGSHETAFNNGDTARELSDLTKEDGIDMDITIVAEDAFDKAIKSALRIIGNGISFGMQTVSKWINQSINESADIDNQVLRDTARNVRDIALSVLTLGLIIIAFANILNLQVDRFGLSKMLPKFVIGVVMAYFSYFIALFLLSFMGALQSLMIQFMGVNNLGNVVSINTLLNIEGDASQNILTKMLNNGALASQAIILLILMVVLLLV